MVLARNQLLALYETMALIRTFEERFLAEVLAGKPMSSGHLYAGEEAVATGVCAHLRPDDYITSTHRGHGHCIAKGVDVKTMMAELMCKVTGICRGKGGSMHIADPSVGMLGANGIVGAGFPLAIGAALSARVRGTDQVAVCFFGDGASNEGTFHESINMAAIWKLPVVFCCENNLYGEATPVEYAVPVKDIAERARAYDIPGVIVDGQDVFAVYEAAEQAIRRARAGEGPTLLECKTYRYYGHFIGDNHLSYRKQEEVDYYRSRDCIERFKNTVVEEGLLAADELERIDVKAKALLDEAVKFAEESPEPPLEDLFTDVYVRYREGGR